MAELHEYAFDVTLYAAIRIIASSEAEAVKKLRQQVDGANAMINYDSGMPRRCEVSMADMDPEVFEVDGVEV